MDPANRAGILPSYDQIDERRPGEEDGECIPPHADLLSELGAFGPGHVKPVPRLDLQAKDLRAYVEGTQVEHRGHTVTDEANLAGIVT